MIPNGVAFPKPEDLQAEIDALGIQAIEQKYDGASAEWDCVVEPQDSQDMTLVGHPPQFPKLQTIYRLKDGNVRPNPPRTVKMRARLKAIQDWREHPQPHIKIIFEESEVLGSGQDSQDLE